MVRFPGELARRVSVVHAARAQTIASEVAQRLRRENLGATTRVVSRTLLGGLLDEQPDAVMIVFSPAAFDVIRLCRDVSSAIDSGVIVLAPPASFDEATVIGMLDAGAAEIVDVDTPGAVLAAHVRVAMRAHPRLARRKAPITIGDLVIDADAHVVSVAGQVVKVRPLQFQLLAMLAHEAGSVISREHLLREVWGVEPDGVDPRRLRITISALRRVLGRGPSRPEIESVARFGYRLTVP